MHYSEIKQRNDPGLSAAVFVLTETQTTVNVLTLNQSRSPHLWEVPRSTSGPGLHLQAFVGSRASDGTCSRLPVQVFVINVHSQMEARYLSVSAVWAGISF